MKTVFMFPGQGAQFPGMARDLYDYSAAVRDLFASASEVTHKDIAALLFDSTEEELKQTDNTQIAVTVANLAARQVLSEFGIESDMSAGFSLGEYAALVDAGVLRYEDAVTAVLHRGRIMERVSRTLDDDAGRAGMVATMGKDLPEVAAILSGAGVTDAYPSLYNSPVQTVVGGSARALAGATDALKAGGVRRVIPLKVSGPFHTPLMAPARDAFAHVLGDIPFSDPLRPTYSNVHGRTVGTGEEARTLCLEQLVRTVLWTTEERQLLTDGAELLLEVGPGSVLQGLWKAVSKADAQWPSDRCRTAGTLEEIEGIAKEFS